MPQNTEVPLHNHRLKKPDFLTDTTFSEFALPPEVHQGLSDAGFTFCTPIQARTLPISLGGRDIAGQAQTGTGKTAAFLITVFSRLMALSGNKKGAALIVAPTRELAQQIFDEAKKLGVKTGLTITQVLGGVDYQKQARALKKNPDIIICTPGRIIDYFKQGIFKTGRIRIVVIDEADRLFDLGFTKDMRFILKNLPHYEKRQTMLFSATLSYRVLELTYEYMNLPEFISVTPEEITVEGIDQTLFHVGLDSKLSLLLGLLKREDCSRALIFSNTKADVEWLTQKLKGNGWLAEGITGDLPQSKRFSLMKRFKKGDIKILVATDVAARGIHVEDISHVINYDLPQDSENYVHRIGRTARAGKKGKALSLACEKYVFHLEPLETMLNYKIPVAWPEDKWYLPDQCGPVAIKRKSRLKKTAQKRRQGREKTDAYSRTRANAISPPKPPGYFPGTFFGFAPESAAEEIKPGPSPGKKTTSRKNQLKNRKKS